MGPIHAEAMCWLRFGKRLPIVTTEVGRWNADVLGMSRTTSLEVEVKISISDLQAEFRNKTTKHWTYANAPHTASVPNSMYFCMPEELVEKAQTILAEKAPYAGLMAYAESNALAGRRLTCVKRAKKLNQARPSERAYEVALMRMSSQLCGLQLLQVDFQQKLLAQVQYAREETLKSVEAFSTVPDAEPAEE